MAESHWDSAQETLSRRAEQNLSHMQRLIDNIGALIANSRKLLVRLQKPEEDDRSGPKRTLG